MTGNRAGEVTQTPRWEKISALAGFVLLLGGFILLAWSAITEERAPPHFAFAVDKVTAVGDKYLVEVEVTNQGSQSVAALQIEAELKGEDDKPELASAQIDYVPSGSERDVGLYFSSDPRAGELTFRPLGYQEP